MLIPYFAVLMFSAVMVLGGGTVSAQDYPNRPIRIVTSAGAGASSDFLARVIAQEISTPLGQPVIVDTRASIFIQGELVSKAPPNGYTLLFAGPAFWIAPLMGEHTPYDPVRDFLPITFAVRGVNLLAIPPSLPIKSVKELIALAKAKPGELNYASAGTGTGTHLAAELFKAMAGVDIVRISYQGVGPALNDLVGGQVHLMFASTTSAMPYVKSGKVRAVAITSAQASALAPDLPTVAASGLPGYEVVTINGIFAPAKTPVSIIHRLNQEIVRALNKSDVKEKFFTAGLEAVGSSPEELRAAIQSDMTRFSKLIKDAGIKNE